MVTDEWSAPSAIPRGQPQIHSIGVAGGSTPTLLSRLEIYGLR
jgi:hypothetical protein